MSSESRPELGPRASLRSWTRFSNPLLEGQLDLERVSVLMYGMFVLGLFFFIRAGNSAFVLFLGSVLYGIDIFGYRRIRKEV